MQYTMIQTHAVNSNLYAIVKLHDNAYKAPAGYIVGKYDVIRDNLSYDKAKQYLNALI